jgi:hypothetical protein
VAPRCRTLHGTVRVHTDWQLHLERPSATIALLSGDPTATTAATTTPETGVIILLPATRPPWPDGLWSGRSIISRCDFGDIESVELLGSCAGRCGWPLESTIAGQPCGHAVRDHVRRGRVATNATAAATGTPYSQPL